MTNIRLEKLGDSEAGSMARFVVGLLSPSGAVLIVLDCKVLLGACVRRLEVVVEMDFETFFDNRVNPSAVGKSSPCWVETL